MPHGNAIRLFVVVFLVGLAAMLVFERRPSIGPGDGEFGWTPNPAGVERFLAELPQPMFAQAGAETIREARGVDTFLYRSAVRAHVARYGKPWVCGRQGIGDCVSWGWMHGIWIAQAVDWETGRLAEPPLMPDTTAIYGGSRVESRNKPGDGASPVGGWSDGSYGAAAARWVRDWGVVYREPFPDLGYDLTNYSAERAKQWGAYGAGGQGDKGRLDKLAKKHPAAHIAMVTTWEEACSAIEAGFPIPVASNVGFQSVTDEHGYAVAGPTWNHEMLFCAVRYQRNGSPEDALLCLNSWGPKWLTYKGKFPADQPDGSFWVSRKTVERMLAQRDSFAVGSVQGFGWRELDNGGFLQPAPPETIAGEGR
jgi:hypothetical protein